MQLNEVDVGKGIGQGLSLGQMFFAYFLKSEWTPGVGDGQGGLACCDSWGRKESDTTERLNWTELNWRQMSLEDRQSHEVLAVGHVFFKASFKEVAGFSK